MALWVKKNSSDWVDVQKVWVKKSPTLWVAAKKIWVKNASSIWSQFWPEAGPYPEEELELTASKTLYPSSGTAYPILTARVYHFYFDGSLTLKYKWSASSTATGPWTDLTGYTTYQTYSPGNPSLGSSNTISITPELTEYVSGRVYFKFTMQATDASGIATREVVSDPITVDSPIWNTEPAFSGTPATGYTLKWNAGKAYISGVSDNVGYHTTIYRTIDNGITKEYLYGTALEPDFQFSDNYEYSFLLNSAAAGYTYYASTYAVFSDIDGEKANANRSSTVSAQKTVASPPGAFSITSATKGKYISGIGRTISVQWSTSQYATSYEFSIQSSSDQINWTDHVVYGNSGIVPPTTATTYNIGSNSPYVRVTMRSTNSSGLYAYTATVFAEGTAPTAPVITSATSTTTDVVLTFTPPSDNGSSDDIRYWVAYKTTSSGTWGNFSLATVNNNTIRFYDILASGTSYDFKIKAQNFDQLYSPESNVFTISTKIAPGPITNVYAKSFDLGYLTTFFTTGTNTTNMNVNYEWFQTQPVLGDSQNFDVPVSSSSKYYVTNSSALLYPNEQYNISLTANNEFGISRDYGNVFFIMPNGSDKPTATTPTFSNIATTSFDANFTLTGSVTHVIIDIRAGGSSISGFPQTISASAGSNTYTAANLSNSTSYTFYVTPQYKDSIYTSFSYNGTTVSSTVTTTYQFLMGKTLHVGTNGYISLTNASTSITLPSTGIVLSIYNEDFVQAQTTGADGSGLLHYWSNSDTYVVRWSGYQYGYLNNGNYRVTYEAKFYTNQSYCDIKYIHVGSNVWSNAAPRSRPGIYANGSLVSNGIPGPYVLSTGNTYRIYYNGSLPTSSVSFTDVEQADMVSAGGVSGGSSDEGYTSLTTSTNQYTYPTITFGTATITSSSISVPVTGTFYSYDYTIRTGSYSGTIVASGSNQSSSTISASSLSSLTTYYLTASPKNSWSQYGNNTQNSYATTDNLIAPYNGSVSVSPSSGTAGSTTFTATPSGWLGNPSTFTYTYSWQYLNTSFQWSQFATGSTAVAPNVTAYAWQVVLTVSNGVTPNGIASASFSVSAPVSKLATPTGVNASDNRTDGVLITWNAVSGASYYGIWWGGPPGYDYSPDFGGPGGAGGWNGSGTSFLDTSISAGSSRTYYVQAYASGNPAGTKSEWSAGDSGTRTSAPVGTAPSAPGAVTAAYSSGPTWACKFNYSSSGTQPITYNWYFYAAANNSGLGQTLVTSGSVIAASYNSTYTIGNLGNGGTGYVWGKLVVTASNSYGSATADSGWN